MTTITTNQIANRLSQSYLEVRPLNRIDGQLPVKAAHSQVISQIPFSGITLVCGVYSLTDDIDNGEYQRFVYVPETAQTFTF